RAGALDEKPIGVVARDDISHVERPTAGAGEGGGADGVVSGVQHVDADTEVGRRGAGGVVSTDVAVDDGVPAVARELHTVKPEAIDDQYTPRTSSCRDGEPGHAAAGRRAVQFVQRCAGVSRLARAIDGDRVA